MTQFVDSQGVLRSMGNLPAPVRLSWKVYGDAPDEEIIDRSKWADLIGNDTGPDDPYMPPLADQDGIGMCNCSATCTSIEGTRLQEGLPYVQLSGGDLYYRISGGVDRGSLLEEGIAEAMKNGVASTAVVPYLDWRTNYGTKAKQDRLRFKVLEAKLLPTFGHLMSAVFKRRRIISGVMWYSNYDPDSEGWLPAGRGGAGGHAICGYKPTMRNGKFGVWHQNSWADWGPLHGRFVLPEPAFDGPVGGWWAVCSTTTEAGDIPAPAA